MLDLALALGVSKRNRLSDAIILALFSNNEQGAYYDPYDLTDEKMAWRRNLLLWSEDFSKSPWMSIHVFVETTDVPAPNGGYATKVTKGEGTALRLQALDVNTSNQQTKSIYARTVTGTGTVALLGIAWDSKNVRTLTEQWQRFDIPVELADAGGSTFYAVDFRVGTLTEVLIADAQLDKAELTPYQKITNFNSDFMAQFPNHTLFQDHLGTIPVTGNMQPLGLGLDKRFGGVRGENLRDGFVVHNSGVASNPFGFYDIDTGNFGINRVDVNDRRDLRIFNLNPSVMYEITIENTSNNAIQVRNDSASNTLVIIAAFTTVRLVSTTGNSDVFSILSTGNDSEATGIIHSIRPILGNHVHQPVSAARPLWQNNGGLKSFWFDGIDDHLLTVNTVNMLNTSQLQILTGFRKENSAVGILIHSDSGTDETFTANQIEVFLRTFTSAERYTTRLRNSLNDNVFEANASGYPINANNVMTNSIDSMAAISTVRINNDTEHSESGEGSSASLWDQQIFIGCRKGSVWYFGGHIYSLIIRSTLTEETQAEPIRQLLATRSGVTL